ALLLAPLALDERPEIPAAVRLFAAGDARPHDTHATDDYAGLQQLADAVAHFHAIDGDQRSSVARETDAVERETAEERSAERVDLERRAQILVRLTNDQLSNLILGPAGFEQGEADADGDQESDDDAKNYADDASEPSHLIWMLSTARVNCSSGVPARASDRSRAASSERPRRPRLPRARDRAPRG